jgi:thiosulfate reductase cytochrome b subunit
VANRTASRKSAHTSSIPTACREPRTWESLATARNWHLLFAWFFVLNGIAYVVFTVFSGHLRRDLVPSKTELRGIGSSLKDHLLFRYPSGAAAKRYNVLQSSPALP